MGYVIELKRELPEKFVFLGAGNDWYGNHYGVFARQPVDSFNARVYSPDIRVHSPDVRVAVYPSDSLKLLNRTQGDSDPAADWALNAVTFVKAEQEVAGTIRTPFVIGGNFTVSRVCDGELIATISPELGVRVAVCEVRNASKEYRRSMAAPNPEYDVAASVTAGEDRKPTRPFLVFHPQACGLQ